MLAPTAGGKTEAAFFPLISEALARPWDGLAVLYVCPIKALLNNQQERLERYYGLVGRRAAVWHGDVPASAKRRILADPPDCLLTTPESLEVMLVSASIRHDRLFADVRAVVVDEVHAFAGDDRGWHLLALLQRIGRLAGRDLQRIGLSATVGNQEELLAWLSAGSDAAPAGDPARPPSPSRRPRSQLDYVGSLDNAATVIAALHRGEKRLVFCDSRARVEQLAADLRHAGRRDVRLAQLAGAGRAAAGRAGVRRGPRLRDRGHQRAGAGHRRRRPRPRHPDRRPGHRLVVPAADGPHRTPAGRGAQLPLPGDLRRGPAPGRRPDRAVGRRATSSRPSRPPSRCTSWPSSSWPWPSRSGGIGRTEWLDWVRAVPAFAAMDGPRGRAARRGDARPARSSGTRRACSGWAGEGQDAYGRKNFLDLISVFTAPPLFAVQHGRPRAGLGRRVDLPGPPRGRPAGPPAGGAGVAGDAPGLEAAAWRTSSRPRTRAARAGAAQGQFLGRELCGAIRRVLAADEVAGLLGRGGRVGRIEAVRAEFPWLARRPENALVAAGDELAWWTFAGGRANAALASDWPDSWACGSIPTTSPSGSTRVPRSKSSAGRSRDSASPICVRSCRRSPRPRWRG